jgi:tetratricopeptide (TPR) repeat protein
MKLAVYLDLTGWYAVGNPKSNSRTWESITTEKLTLEIKLPPLNMPELGNLDAMRRYYRDRMRRARAAVISCDCIRIGDLHGLKTILKAPAGNGRAMSYTAELLVSIRDRVVALIVSGIEFAITGIREAAVLQELAKSGSPQQLEQLNRSEIPLEWKFERYEPGTRGEFAYLLSDDEGYDQRFPWHPLTVVRRRMNWLEQSFGVVGAGANASSELPAGPAAKPSGTLLSRFARNIGRDPQPLRINLQPDQDQFTIEKPISFAPSFADVQRQLGKDIADDLRESASIPLSARQKQYRERVERQCQELLKSGNTKAANSVTGGTGLCGSDGKLSNLPGLKEEMQRVPQSLPDLMLSTSEESEKCWVLELPPENSWPVLKLNSGVSSLPLFTSQALAENFATRKQLAFRSVCISAVELWKRLQDCPNRGISAIVMNPCPECLHLAIATNISSFTSSRRLLEFLVLDSALLHAKGNWALQTALGEADLKQRFETLCLALTHFDPGHPELHLEVIRTARVFNNTGIILESARRLQRYSPDRLVKLADLLSERVDQQPEGAVETQRHAVLAVIAACSELAAEYSGAIEFFSECISRRPDDVPAHLYLGGALWYAGELEKALDVFSRGLLLSSQDGNLLSARGQILVEIGEYDKALSDLDDCLEKAGIPTRLEESPKVALRAYTLSGRGAAYAGLGKFEAAQKDFNEPLALCPRNAWVYYNIALACEWQGDIDTAVRNYTISLKMREPKLNESKRTAALARLAILRPDSDANFEE